MSGNLWMFSDKLDDEDIEISMTRSNSKSRAKRSKPEKLEFVQPFLPVKDIRNGIVETTDGRYVKILEIEPINFLLRSSEEQYNGCSTG